MRPSVYILQSLKNDRYYIGSSNDVKRRLVEHNQGRSRYTRSTYPFKLKFSQEYDTLEEARNIESRIKKLKSRIIVEQIVKEQKIRLTR